MRTATFIPLLLFLVSCTGGKAPADKERRVLANVNGVPITLDEFRREFARVRLDDEEGQPTAESMAAQRNALLDSLIETLAASAQAIDFMCATGDETDLVPCSAERLQDPDLADRGRKLVQGRLIESHSGLLIVGLDVVDGQHGEPGVVGGVLGRDQRLEPSSQSPTSLTHGFSPPVRVAPGTLE